MDVYDLPGSRIAFDVILDATLLVRDADIYHNDKTEATHRWFKLQCEGDLSCNLSDMRIKSIAPHDGKMRKPLPMSDSLVRYIYKIDLEMAAIDFLKNHYVEKHYHSECFLNRDKGAMTDHRSASRHGRCCRRDSSSILTPLPALALRS